MMFLSKVSDAEVLASIPERQTHDLSESEQQLTDEDWRRYRERHDGSPCSWCGTTIEEFLKDDRAGIDYPSKQASWLVITDQETFPASSLSASRIQDFPGKQRFARINSDEDTVTLFSTESSQDYAEARRTAFDRGYDMAISQLGLNPPTAQKFANQYSQEIILPFSEVVLETDSVREAAEQGVSYALSLPEDAEEAYSTLASLMQPKRAAILQHKSGVAHVIGDRDTPSSFLPKFASGMSKTARKRFSPLEKQALIDEPGTASNLEKIDIRNTHYEKQSASEIALLILPLKGLH